MILQYILIAFLVTGALSYLAMRLKKTFASNEGCASGCGCASKELRKTVGTISSKPH